MLIYYIGLLWIAIFPTIVILSIVYKKDKEREPKKLLITLFLLGILSCFLTIVLTEISDLFFPFMTSKAVKQSGGNYYVLILHSFVQVAFIEEMSKWIFNYSLVWNNKEFDHIYDSIVYSVFVSLGFATFENILFVLTYGIRTGLLRAVTSVPAHAFFAVNMGYYLGFAKLSNVNGNKKLVNKYKFYSVIIPMFLHGLFDFGLMSNNTTLVYVSFTLVIYLYVTGIKRVKQFSNITTNLVNNS